VLRRKFIVLTTKEEKPQINNLRLHLKNPEKKKEQNPKQLEGSNEEQKHEIENGGNKEKSLKQRVGPIELTKL
jgi:hypothetical protein